MLTFKSMKWSNCFSYGKNNYIEFDKNILTQLVGINGTGKTSISLMLQEVLYGKNIKNIKKQDIANNKSGETGYWIHLIFEKDGALYEVDLNRKSNLKFRLIRNGKDISSHTSLNTYKTLANIIGVTDFKIFCQLIYQHSTDSLDFLTATDTNRKRFLISLLQLDKYITIHELFKSKAVVLNSEISGLAGSVDTVEAWITRHKDMDLMKQVLMAQTVVDPELYIKRDNIQSNITNINSINKKIVANKQYRIELNLLDPQYFLGIAPGQPNPGSNELRTQVRILDKQYTDHMNTINRIDNIEGECPTCLQPIDPIETERLLDHEIFERNQVKTKIGKLWEKIPKVEAIEAEIRTMQKQKADFEKLNQLIDSNLQLDTLDKNELTNQLIKINAQIFKAESLAKSIKEKNLKISAHNSKVDVVYNQLKEFKKDLHEKNINLMKKENLNTIIELLKKTFGTNGLVSYKIESSVKELEKKINDYLSDLTQFQIYFKLSGEKLNIEVVDDIGNVTSISNLSSGERARVNIATILAIRSILSSLTSTKINLLFLDEVIGVIDAEGKEKLSEILLQENLNTFIVSHDWTHPLIPKIHIIKEHHISRIEYD